MCDSVGITYQYINTTCVCTIAEKGVKKTENYSAFKLHSCFVFLHDVVGSVAQHMLYFLVLETFIPPLKYRQHIVIAAICLRTPSQRLIVAICLETLSKGFHKMKDS